MMRELRLVAVKQQGTLSERSLSAGSLAAQYSFALVFLVTLIASLWAAYDSSTALQRFVLLLVGVSLLILLPLISRLYLLEDMWLWVMRIVSLITALVGALYVARSLPRPVYDFPIPLGDNQVGGVMVIGLPLALGAFWLGLSARHWCWVGITGASLVVGFVAFVLSGSRGAWIGFTAGLVAALYLVLRGKLAAYRPRRAYWLWFADIAMVAAFCTALALYLAVILSPGLDASFGIDASGGSASSRLALWRDTIPLIQDYYFVGSGLASTAMIYSTYAFLLHVPYLYHAHNLYLQIALEQGVPGLLAFLGLMGTAIMYAAAAWKQTEWRGRVALAAAVAAVIALLVHGLFDAELYVSTLATLVFLPPTVLMLVAVTVTGQPQQVHETEMANLPTVGGLLTGLLLPVILVLLVPGAPARWEANLGAVLQSRTELRIYHWPEWALQDQVRRLMPDALRPAVAHLQRAVSLDPEQPTAQRRLGQIALAQGDMGSARNHLLTAIAVDPGNRVARQLLGEVFAVEGDIDRAVELWQTVDNGQQQLETRQWWYNSLGADVEANRIERVLRVVEYQDNTGP